MLQKNIIGKEKKKLMKYYDSVKSNRSPLSKISNININETKRTLFHDKVYKSKNYSLEILDKNNIDGIIEQRKRNSNQINNLITYKKIRLNKNSNINFIDLNINNYQITGKKSIISKYNKNLPYLSKNKNLLKLESNKHIKNIPIEIPIISNSGIFPEIHPKIVIEFMNGKYEDKFHHFIIIDCRYSYEYQGGHIKGSININNNIDVESLYKNISKIKSNLALIFHCEFSKNRGPKLAQEFRQQDRKNNIYPNINFPYIFIINGGYRNFFNEVKKHSNSKSYCVPYGYVKMKSVKKTSFL